MLRGLKKFLKHPGTWMLSALILMGIAMAAPVVSPILVPLAAVGLGIGLIATIPYGVQGISKNRKTFLVWIDNHPIQAGVIGIGVALFIAAFVLTIGFFTGGASFIFMTPVFAAIATPFVAASTTGGMSLSIPALVGFTFIMAPLTLANNLKRFLAWLDSFKYDTVAEMDDAINSKENNWKDIREREANKLIEEYGYLETIRDGITNTLFSTDNIHNEWVTGCFVSPDAEKLEKQHALEFFNSSFPIH